MLAWSGFYSVSKSKFSMLASCDVIKNQDISFTKGSRSGTQSSWPPSDSSWQCYTYTIITCLEPLPNCQCHLKFLGCGCPVSWLARLLASFPTLLHFYLSLTYTEVEERHKMEKGLGSFITWVDTRWAKHIQICTHHSQSKWVVSTMCLQVGLNRWSDALFEPSTRSSQFFFALLHSCLVNTNIILTLFLYLLLSLFFGWTQWVKA